MIVPASPPVQSITKADLQKITKADLYYSFWSNGHSKADIFLNGQKIGKLKPNTFANAWWNTYRIEIDPKLFSAIKQENEIVIKNQAKEIFGVVHCLLRISTETGKQVSSSISDHMYLSCPVKDAYFKTERYVPVMDMLKTVELGHDIRPTKLKFQ